MKGLHKASKTKHPVADNESTLASHFTSTKLFASTNSACFPAVFLREYPPSPLPIWAATSLDQAMVPI